MNANLYMGRATQQRLSVLLLGAALLGMPTDVHAGCGLDGAVLEQLWSVDDPQALRALTTKIRLHGICSACHLAKWGGPRNEYGNAVNTLLTQSDRKETDRQLEAGRRMMDVLADPARPDSPTFRELLRQGRFPANSLANQEPPLLPAPARVTESVTPEQAKELVKRIEAESGVTLQLSRTEELTPETATALAEFRGEMLMLGVRSLTPETAAALAKSRVENLWLHSVTSLSPEAAETLAKLRGHLILTGLTQLESVPLAKKLAQRPGALSFPYLKSLTPEIAAALAKDARSSLTLAGLTDVSTEVQEKLAETFGGLSLPNLTSLDSLPLAKKLAATVVLLPEVQKLSAEQAELLIARGDQGSFFGGIYLSLSAVTPEVANVLAANPSRVNLTLVGNGPLSDSLLRTLLRSSVRLTLRDVEELTAGQIRIVAEALAGTSRSGPLDLPRLSLPSLRKLDSGLLAEAFSRSARFNLPGVTEFAGVTEISPEAAAALGSLPDKEYIGPGMKRIMGPSGNLYFPSLQELSPETARLLMQKRWVSISLPALEEVSLETVRLLARQTSKLTLGIPSLPTEFAAAFAELPTRQPMAGDHIAFPNLTDLSPEAARILVKSLNRGFREVPKGFGKFSNSPKLSFGGVSGFATLSPALAVELAKYEGNLAIEGLGELPDESAAALASFPGPRLILSGRAAERLTPEAAASLARVPGVLKIQSFSKLLSKE